MAKQIINVGARNNDGTGDSLRVGATKVNDNFSEIYNLLGDGENLSVVSRINAGQGLAVSNSTGVVLITGRVASANDLGVIKVGENLTISPDGTLSAQQTVYSLPTASSTVLGGVKVGTGLSINQGVISSNNPTPYTLPIATSSIRGGVKIGANISVSPDGTISGNPDYLLPTATDSILGGIKIGAGLSISQGVVSVTSTGGSSDRLVNGINEVVLGTDGTTTLPNALNVANGDNGSIAGENGISVRSLNGNQLSLGFTRSLAGMPAPDNANISAFFLDGSGASIEVNTDTAGNIWQFDTNGNTTLPGGIRQSYQDNTSCSAGVDTVIYTSTDGDKHAIKLFVIVEGSQGSSWETQACDIIAVKGFVNDIVHVTAYGVTYSGATPLATFDGRWNALTSKIEITCQPTALNNVKTSVHAIEMTTND